MLWPDGLEIAYLLPGMHILEQLLGLCLILIDARWKWKRLRVADIRLITLP